MTITHTKAMVAAPLTAPVYPAIAAFAETLDRRDPLYWPACAASDGCEASLAELNAMLEADDCHPFGQDNCIPPVPA